MTSTIRVCFLDIVFLDIVFLDIVFFCIVLLMGVALSSCTQPTDTQTDTHTTLSTTSISLIHLDIPSHSDRLQKSDDTIDRAAIEKQIHAFFSLEQQIPQTYTPEELQALDTALQAMGMTPVDMDFKKKYTDGKLAFPIILDMMAHPLHIAPFMDGMAQQLTQDSASMNPSGLLPELILSIRLHPAFSDIPDLDTLLTHPTKTIPKPDLEPLDISPEPSQALQELIRQFQYAAWYADQAFANLTPDEKRILRDQLPKAMSWHDTFPSPYGEEIHKQYNQWMKQQDEDMLDQIIQKVNFHALLNAYLCLPSPSQFEPIWDRLEFPESNPESYITPMGTLVLGTLNDDRYTGEITFLIEPGGNDLYQDCRVGSARGTDNHRIGFCIDRSGADYHLSHSISFTQGAALLGVAAFYDMGHDPDVYRAGHGSQGIAMCGLGTMVDAGGSDTFQAKIFAQGATGYGIGLLINQSLPKPETSDSPANTEEEEIDPSLLENDLYEAWEMAQAFARQWGIAICHGGTGNDRYISGGVYLHAPLFNDRYHGYSQGFAIGERSVDIAGGLALLLDDNGNDTYIGDIYNQGVGYWYGAGFLYDRAGNDHYEMAQYGQGSGIHLAIGGLIDVEGSDSYSLHVGLGQGSSHDFAASVFMDRAGDDRYAGSSSSNGVGLTNAVGLFLDRSGNDMYGGGEGLHTLGSGRPARDMGSIGIFVDAAGNDYYYGPGANDSLWLQSEYGCGIDSTPEESKTIAADTTKPEQTKEPYTDIPEICFYEGELSKAVFDELWEIAVRWKVGDNRYIVPKARERIIAFADAAIPFLHEEFGNHKGLVIEAFQSIFPKIHKTHPAAVNQFLTDNLTHTDEQRQRNAIRIIGTLKIASFANELVPFLSHENEKLITTALQALQDINQPSGIPEIHHLLHTHNSEMVLIRAAHVLVQFTHENQMESTYTTLKGLLQHKLFTIRNGIAKLLANEEKPFIDLVLADLQLPESLEKAKCTSLLRVLLQRKTLTVSESLMTALTNASRHSDWTVRIHVARLLKKKGLEDSGDIHMLLSDMMDSETDSYVKGILKSDR